MAAPIAVRLGKGAGYVASLIGVAMAGVALLLPGRLLNDLLVALLFVAISLAAAYAVRTERLVLVWVLVIAFGVVSTIGFFPLLLLLGVLLYAIAAILLTVDGFVGRSHAS